MGTVTLSTRQAKYREMGNGQNSLSGLGDMTCEQINSLFDAGRHASWSEEARKHISKCNCCYNLLLVFENPTEGSQELSSAVRHRIVRHLTETLNPVSPLPPARHFALILIGAFLLITVLFIGTMGAPAIPAMSAWQLAGVIALIGAGVVLFATSLSRQMIPGSRHSIAPRLLIIGFLTGFLFGVALLFPWKSSDHFLASGRRCWLGGLMVAVPAAAVFWIIIRKGAPVSLGTLGASIGLIAGLAGATVLQFQCLVLRVDHVAVWHLGVIAVCTLAGFFLGRFFTHRV